MLVRERDAGDLQRLHELMDRERDALRRDRFRTLRGKDVVRILDAEFGVTYSLDGVYDLLERLNYSCLAPRPRHEKNDPIAQRQFKEQAPFLSRR
jgi:transposase